jgi:hypothetical protein
MISLLLLLMLSMMLRLLWLLTLMGRRKRLLRKLLLTLPLLQRRRRVLEMRKNSERKLVTTLGLRHDQRVARATDSRRLLPAHNSAKNHGSNPREKNDWRGRCKRERVS